MSNADGFKANMSGGRGKITPFRPVDQQKKPEVRKPIKHDSGFNLGTYDVSKGTGQKKA